MPQFCWPLPRQLPFGGSRMNSTTSYGLSDYQARTLAIESTGFCDRSMIRPGNCIVRVPFSSLSQTMQSIHRMGGKVAQVTLLSPGGEAVGTAVSQALTPTASPAHKLLEKISLRGQSPQQSPPSAATGHDHPSKNGGGTGKHQRGQQGDKRKPRS